MECDQEQKYGLRCLNTGSLKLVAVLSMTIDHIGAALLPQYLFLRVIGRLAFPIYCYMIVNGLFYTKNCLRYFGRLLTLLAAYIAYIVLHELTHAAAMRFFGGGKVRFGFTGMYAYAGSETDYFDRFAYRIIALAPLVVWGVVFALLMVLVPRAWFWVAAFLQLGNISGAAGDIYVACRLQTVPRDTLTRDTGLAMWMYSAAEDR